MKKFILIPLLLALFCAHVAASDEINAIAGIASKNPSWEYGVTSVSSLCDIEKAKMGGAIASVAAEGDRIIYAPPIPMFPGKFDWRTNGGVTPIKTQGSCGSCWAFSALAAIESKILIDEDKLVDLSEQHMISCSPAGSCGGGWPDMALDYVRDIGVPDEACYPYCGRTTQCETCDNWDSIAWQIEDHVYVSPTTDSFKFAIQEYGPISVVITVPEDWFYYRSGLYEPTYEGGLGWANHAVLLTGWDDSEGCWFVKNSWGPNWGENGYARVRYGVIEQYNYAYAVTGIVEHGAAPDPEWIVPASASATSEYADKHPATNAIDGDVTTHWFAKVNDKDATITFDMGDVRQSSAVGVAMFRLDVPTTIDIRVSRDGTEWTTILDDVAITESDTLVALPCESSGRYFQITDIRGARIYDSVSEFAVQCMPATGLTLTLNYQNSTEIISIDGLVSLMVSGDGIDRLIWLN